MAVHSNVRSRIHWLCARAVYRRCVTQAREFLSVFSVGVAVRVQCWNWLCEEIGGVRGNTTQHNGANVVFRQACVREFSSPSERVRAAGAATATGWLLNLEGWVIGYLGNRRENHSILLAAYHARGESSSQKTLRCILPIRCFLA